MRMRFLISATAVLSAAGFAVGAEPVTAAAPAAARVEEQKSSSPQNAPTETPSASSEAETVRVQPVDASARQQPAKYNGPMIRVREERVTRASRDARVEYGDVRISRLRVEELPAASVGGEAASPARLSGGAIVVPSNTFGPGESLQQRATRDAAERRSLEAQAREDEARAQVAQRIAERSNDIIDDSVVYAGGRTFYYPGAIHGGGGYRPPGLRGPVTITRERFVNTDAYFNVAEAARPPIADTQRGIDEAVRQASEPLRHREIGRIQRQTDEAQRRNLQRVPVEGQGVTPERK